MDKYDGTPVSVQKRMSVCEIAHDLARFCFHESFVLPMSECMVGCKLNIVRVCKEHGTSTDRKARSSRTPVLSGPGRNGFKENSVPLEHIGIGKLIDIREALR